MAKVTVGVVVLLWGSVRMCYLPITGIYDETSYFLQPFFVLIIETIESEAVQIKDAYCLTVPEYQGNDNFAFCLPVTGYVARVFIDIRYDEGPTLEKSVGADTMTAVW